MQQLEKNNQFIFNKKFNLYIPLVLVSNLYLRENHKIIIILNNDKFRWIAIIYFAYITMIHLFLFVRVNPIIELLSNRAQRDLNLLIHRFCIFLHLYIIFYEIEKIKKLRDIFQYIIQFILSPFPNNTRFLSIWPRFVFI